MSTTSFQAFELEIVVNYPVNYPVHTWTENGSFMQHLSSWSVPFWLVIVTEHEVPHCYALNVVYCWVVAGQLYPSCGFSLADCRCFQVSNPSRKINSTVTLRLSIRTASFCQSVMILFNFYRASVCWRAIFI